MLSMAFFGYCCCCCCVMNVWYVTCNMLGFYLTSVWHTLLCNKFPCLYIWTEDIRAKSFYFQWSMSVQSFNILELANFYGQRKLKVLSCWSLFGKSLIFSFRFPTIDGFLYNFFHFYFQQQTNNWTFTIVKTIW